MNYVYVTFKGNNKQYLYKTKLPLLINGEYMIVADNITTYSSPVTIIKKNSFDNENLPLNYSIREITRANPVRLPKKKDSGVDKVIFNYKKDTSVVLWKDGAKTILKLSNKDTWDEEKVIALHYMKKFFDGRGYYNDIIKELVKNAEKITEDLWEE